MAFIENMEGTIPSALLDRLLRKLIPHIAGKQDQVVLWIPDALLVMAVEKLLKLSIEEKNYPNFHIISSTNMDVVLQKMFGKKNVILGTHNMVNHVGVANFEKVLVRSKKTYSTSIK